MKKDITLRLELEGILDQWFAQQYGVEVVWTDIKYKLEDGYDVLYVYLDKGRNDIEYIDNTDLLLENHEV